MLTLAFGLVATTVGGTLGYFLASRAAGPKTGYPTDAMVSLMRLVGALAGAAGGAGLSVIGYAVKSALG